MIGGYIGLPIGGTFESEGDVTLTPALFVNSSTFYTQTVTTSYALEATLFVNSSAFQSPTIAASYELLPSLVTDADSFYAITVAASYDLLPALYTDGDTFYDPTVAAAYDLLPDLYEDADTFYSPDIVQGLLLSLFANTNAFHTPAVTADYELLPSLFADDDTFYSVAVTVAYDLIPSLYVDADTFHAPDIVVGVFPPHVANDNVFHPSTVRFFGGGTGLVFPTGKLLAEVRRLAAVADAKRAAQEAEKRAAREALRAEIEKAWLINIGAWVEPWVWPDLAHPEIDLSRMAFEIGGKQLQNKFDAVLFQIMEAERQAKLDADERDLEFLMMMAA